MVDKSVKFVRAYHTSFAAILLAVLACCSTTPPPAPPVKHVAKPKPVASPVYRADEYIEHLSLANLTLSPASTDLTAVDDDLDVIESYTALPPKAVTKKAKKAADAMQQPVRQEVVILECKAKSDQHMQRVVAPYSESAFDRAAIQTLAARLVEKGCTMYNVVPAYVMVSRGDPLHFDDETPQLVAAQIEQRIEALIRTPEHLTPLEEAKTEMKLANLFISAGQRDAAYITVENAKHALAAAETTTENKEVIGALLGDLEAIETHLHSVMPFNL